MISVIIPAYNVEKYIARTLKSVINQSYKNIEIIVINDESTDNTLEIIKSIKYENLKIFNIKNKGPAKARNLGIENAKGKYIFFLDGDDWIEKETLQKLRDGLEDENIDLIISNYYEDDDLNKLIRREEGGIKEIIENTEILNAFFYGEISAAVWNKLYKRSFLNENNIKFSEDLFIAEDIEFIFKVYFYTKKIKVCRDFLIHYIKNPNSITKKDKSLKMEYVFKSLEKIEKFYNGKIPDEFKFKYIVQFMYFEYLEKNESYDKLCAKFYNELLKINVKSLFKMYYHKTISKKTLFFCILNKKIKRLTFFKWSLKLKNKIYQNESVN